MSRFLGRTATISVWFISEYMKDYREGRARIYETTIKSNVILNQIILTVSIASLTAMAALNVAVFVPYPALSFIVIALFIFVILLSTINFYLSGVALRDIQRAYSKDILFAVRKGNREYNHRFQVLQRILSMLVFGGFCSALIIFLILLGTYILGAES